MAPLLVLNGNEIVEATVLRSIGGECGTSPTPEEEEATLLGDIKHDIKPKIKYKLKPKIKHHIELLQVPEQLEIC